MIVHGNGTCTGRQRPLYLLRFRQSLAVMDALESSANLEAACVEVKKLEPNCVALAEPSWPRSWAAAGQSRVTKQSKRALPWFARHAELECVQEQGRQEECTSRSG